MFWNKTVNKNPMYLTCSFPRYLVVTCHMFDQTTNPARRGTNIGKLAGTIAQRLREDNVAVVGKLWKAAWVTVGQNMVFSKPTRYKKTTLRFCSVLNASRGLPS